MNENMAPYIQTAAAYTEFASLPVYKFCVFSLLLQSAAT